MAVGEDAVLFGECKWAARAVGTNILDDLKRKIHPLIQQGNWTRIHYALFSRSGFTSALESQARNEGVLLVDPEGLLAPPGNHR